MAQYRKKPLIVEAEQFWPDKTPWPDGVAVAPSADAPTSWCIPNGEGYRFAVAAGDWVITDEKGERYPSSARLFEEFYEPV